MVRVVFTAPFFTNWRSFILTYRQTSTLSKLYPGSNIIVISATLISRTTQSWRLTSNRATIRFPLGWPNWETFLHRMDKAWAIFRDTKRKVPIWATLQRLIKSLEMEHLVEQPALRYKEVMKWGRMILGI
uniref:Uncharacterized protein n=1 Tax=Cacopsylla melanoneura TaxID=428564 RepID=A0A8D8ZK00_9HEMI